MRKLDMRRIACAATIILLCVDRAVAQCAMCGSATPYAANDPKRAVQTFAVAALVLLVPVGGMVTALAAYLYRHRD